MDFATLKPQKIEWKTEKGNGEIFALNGKALL